MLIKLQTAVATRPKHEQSSFKIKSVFPFKNYTSKISMLAHCQNLNMVLPVIVSTKHVASVQMHKLTACTEAFSPSPATIGLWWLQEPWDREDDLNG